MTKIGDVDIRMMAESFLENGFKEWSRTSHERHSALYLSKDLQSGHIRVTLAHEGFGFSGQVDNIKLTAECSYRNGTSGHVYTFFCRGQTAVDLAVNTELLLTWTIEFWKEQWD